jgi:predicted phage tail protein
MDWVSVIDEFIQTLYKCIVFNNVFQNLSEDKDEQNKKDQSPKNEQNKKDQSPKNSPSKSNLTPKFAGKRLISQYIIKDNTFV